MLYQALYMASPGFCKGILVDYRCMTMIAEDSYGSWIGRAVKEQSEAGAYVILDDPTSSKKAKLPSWLKPAVSKSTLGKLATALKMSPACSPRPWRTTTPWPPTRWTRSSTSPRAISYPRRRRRSRVCFGGPQMGSFMALGGLRIDTQAKVLSVDERPSSGCTRPAATATAVYGNYPAAAVHRRKPHLRPHRRPAGRSPDALRLSRNRRGGGAFAFANAPPPNDHSHPGAQLQLLGVALALDGDARCGLVDGVQVGGRWGDSAAAMFSSRRCSLVVPGMGTILFRGGVPTGYSICRVGRYSISLMSTSSGWLRANATARAKESAGIANSA